MDPWVIMILILQIYSPVEGKSSYKSCECIDINSNQIECSNDENLKYTLKHDSKRLSIECKSNKGDFSNDIYENLPKVNISDTVDRIIFMSCPLVQISFVKIVKKLNSNIQPKSISIVENELNQNGTLKNYHLEGMEDLISLNISNFGSLTSETFRNNINLIFLNLSSNNFKDIPEDIFRTNYKLETIEISHNKQYIQRLPNGLFENMKNLKRLVLDDSKIESLPDDLLRGSEGIVYISMEKNQLVRIPKDLFRDQKNLVKLNLKHNKLNETLNEQFKNVSSLKELNLDFNHLAYFSGSMFNKKSHLTKLTLSHNDLKNVDDLISLDNLSYLDLSYNKLKSDGNDKHYSVTQITYLDMSNNYVSSIEEIWKSNIKLQSLNLSHNIITYLTDDDLNFLSYDITIDLKYNNISKMQFDEKSNVGIQKTTQVLIENNPIHCDCNLYKFKDIFHLKFGDLKCSSPPEQKGKLVEQLNLKDLLCSFTKNCSKHCICGKKLFDTSVVWNCSSVVNTIHSDNKSIENYLEDIRSTDTFNNIKKLYLRGNNISQILVADIPEKIEVLDLGNNNLVGINHSVMNMLNNSKTLQHLNFFGNPIECDCRNYDFLNFLNERSDLVDNYENMTCFNGKKITLIKIHNLCPNVTLIIIIVSVLITFILFLALYIKYHMEIKIIIYRSGFFSCYNENFSLDTKIFDAFISYSHIDQDIVDEILKNLESGPNPLKICVHYRDWVVGDDIYNQITRSVRDSRYTVIVLSADYIDSSWGRAEFRTALRRPLREGGPKIIIILHGDIGPINVLDTELRAYMKTNTYIKSDDPFFWKKLRKGLSCHMERNSFADVQL